MHIVICPDDVDGLATNSVNDLIQEGCILDESSDIYYNML